MTSIYINFCKIIANFVFLCYTLFIYWRNFSSYEKIYFVIIKGGYMYGFIKNVIITFVCHILFRVKYDNLDILKDYDKCLICPNHSRIFDPVFLYPKIDNMYSVAKSELFKNKFIADFLTYCNAIPIDRNKRDFIGTKRILKLLKSHNKIRLLIFPEGGIFEDNYKYNMRNTKNGAVYISSITNIPIIPVYITSRPRFFSTVTVKFDTPFIPNADNCKNKVLLKKEASNLIHSIYKLKSS